MARLTSEQPWPVRTPVVQIKDAESIFMEVEEEEYAKLVAKRRQEEFVEDDGDDLGYKDDGEEAWNRYAQFSAISVPRHCVVSCLICPSSMRIYF